MYLPIPRKRTTCGSLLADRSCSTLFACVSALYHARAPQIGQSRYSKARYMRKRADSKMVAALPSDLQ